ncbi:MAG: phytanoyl-CoA dioxygenase family protein [Nostoc sp. DedVER02]|uniref:phytanoyl-CoA dioxygenase family protein n=1 Tax=unclassified Nostoc TaxID=2593658 RepID=UPI002AD720A2|nr:phytanoyl-CoA dioxygenase family protein [Nostoc sp. DedVER02]
MIASKLDVLSIQHHTESILQNGFTVFPNQLDQSWLDKLNAAADLATIAVDRALSSGIRLSHTLPSSYICAARRFYCWDQSARDLLDHDTVHLLSSAVLGETRLWDMTLLEARHLPEETDIDAFDWDQHIEGFDWHRDFEVSHAQSYLWMFFCLTDTTEENGATWVIPGTHRQEISARYSVEQLRSSRPSSAVQLTAKAGDLVVIDPTMIHSVGQNRSRSNRRLLLVGLCRVDHNPLMNHWAVVPPKRRVQFSPRGQALLQTNNWRLDPDWEVLPENWQRPIDWDLRRNASQLWRRAKSAFKGLRESV